MRQVYGFFESDRYAAVPPCSGSWTMVDWVNASDLNGQPLAGVRAVN